MSHSLATHLPRHVMFSIDNILLDQTHINSVLMPAMKAVASQLALRSWSATIPYRLSGPGPNYKLLLIIKKVKKEKKKKKQTSDSQGVYVIYLTLWTHRTETQLSLKLFKEPKDNLSCTPIKSSRKKKWQQQKCTQLKEQAKCCNVYNVTRPTLLKESVGV